MDFQLQMSEKKNYQPRQNQINSTQEFPRFRVTDYSNNLNFSNSKIQTVQSERDEEIKERNQTKIELDKTKNLLQEVSAKIIETEQEYKIICIQVNHFATQARTLRITALTCSLILIIMMLVGLKQREIPQKITQTPQYNINEINITEYSNSSQFNDQYTLSNQQLAFQKLNISKVEDFTFTCVTLQKEKKNISRQLAEYKIRQQMMEIFQLNKTLINQFQSFLSNKKSVEDQRNVTLSFSEVEYEMIEILIPFLTQEKHVAQLFDFVNYQNQLLGYNQKIVDKFKEQVKRCKDLYLQEFQQYIRQHYRKQLLNEDNDKYSDSELFNGFNVQTLRLRLDNILYNECFNTYEQEIKDLSQEAFLQKNK